MAINGVNLLMVIPQYVMVTKYFVSDIYCEARELAAHISNVGPLFIILEHCKLSW